ncbi:MAG: hypothetical protein IKP40_10125 [Clostridia bacterium]|nr:hypothetical protein [Clostridia bacterium]
MRKHLSASLLVFLALLTLCALPSLADGYVADTPEALLSLIRPHLERCESSFEVQVTSELSRRVWDDQGGGDLLSDFMTVHGVQSWGTSRTVFGATRTVEFTNVSYYAGCRILLAWQTGDTSSLSAREAAALSAAQRFVSSLAGSALDRERAIHDYICANVVYFTDDISDNDNDCAIGGLLNGLADCDGYSDTFFLLCNMAGIPCRFVHGTTLQDKDKNSDSTHMWNAIRLDGKWVMTDVTWDDSEHGTTYLYYNIGSRRMGLNHFWDAAALDFTPEAEDDGALLTADLRFAKVESWEQIALILRARAAARASRIRVQVTADLGIKENSEQLSSLAFDSGLRSFQWDISQDAFELYDLEYPEYFRFCADESDIVSYVDSFAGWEQPPAEFTVFFDKSLGSALCGSECAGLDRVLYASKLAAPIHYTYSSGLTSVTVQNPVYQPDTPHDRAESWEEVAAVLRSRAVQRASRIRVFVPASLNIWDQSDRLSSLVYGCGVSSFQWDISRYVFELYDLEYPGYFRFCADESEIVSYVNSFADQARLPSEFTIFFDESLGSALCGKNCAGLDRVLYGTRLAAPIHYSYSSGLTSVTVLSPAYLPGDVPLATDEDSLYTVLKKALSKQPAEVQFAYGGQLDLERQNALVVRTVASLGVSSSFYSSTGGGCRMWLSGLQYYDEFRVVSTKKQALSYMKSCKKAGISTFVLFCPADVFSDLMENNAGRLFSMLDEAGFQDESISYSEEYGLIQISNAR